MEWYTFALIAGLLSAAGMILQKKVLFKERSVEYNTVSKFFQAIIVLSLIPFLNLNYSWGILIGIYFFSILSVGAIILETKAYRHLEMSSVVPLNNLSPALLLIFAFIFLGEKVSYLQGFGIFTLMAGSYFLEANHHWRDVKGVFNSLKSKYITYFLMGLILGSFLALFNKHFINLGVDVLGLTFLYYIFTWVNFTIITFLFFDGFSNIKHGIKTHGFLIFIIALFYVVHRLSYLKALTLGYVSLVIPLTKINVLLATFIGGGLFHEHHVKQRTIACLIMLIGAYLIIVG